MSKKLQLKYTKWHNNYALTLGNVYEGYLYKKGWYLVYYDYQTRYSLFREECFQVVKEN